GWRARWRTAWWRGYCRAGATWAPTRATLCQYGRPESESVLASDCPGRWIADSLAAAWAAAGAAPSAGPSGAGSDGGRNVPVSSPPATRAAGSARGRAGGGAARVRGAPPG